MYYYFVHTQLWFPGSDCDFRRYESDFQYFCEFITGENIVEDIESIMGTHAEQSSPLWVYIPQKSLVITCDFWNTNSFGWSPFGTGAHDRFSISLGIALSPIRHGHGESSTLRVTPGTAYSQSGQQKNSLYVENLPQNRHMVLLCLQYNFQYIHIKCKSHWWAQCSL